MKKTKTQKGITLIALIITIIILLILAVVAINAIKGDGVIQYAQNAATGYEDAKANEESILSQYEMELAKMKPKKISEVTIGAEFKKTTFVSDEEGKIFVVPAGFTIVKDSTTNNKVSVDEGVVIKHATEESQFVWVPVTTEIKAYGEPDVATGVTPSETVDSASGEQYDAVKANLDLAGCTEDLNGDNVVNAYDFKIQLTNEFNSMVASVKTYGGFYVGRYETSISSGKAQSKKSIDENPITSATAAADSANTWYGFYALEKGYSTSSVQGSMIWGGQYDAMMTWMKNTGTDIDGTIEGDNETNNPGTAENDVINNVYDMYGNRMEWTMRAAYDRYARTVRQEGYISSNAPSLEYPIEPTSTSTSIGSRLALYIL